MVIISVRKATIGKTKPRPAHKRLKSRHGAGNRWHEYDIRRYCHACSGYAGEPPCKAEQPHPPKDFINAFPFHRLVIFSGQGFDTPPGLVFGYAARNTKPSSNQ